MPELESVLEIFKTFLNHSFFEIGFLISCCYCVLTGSVKTKKQIIVIGVLGFLCVGNDLSYKILLKVAETATYYRFFWMFPIVFVITYAFVHSLGKEQVRYAAVFCAVVLLGAFCLQGESYFSKELLRKPSNIYLVEDDIIVLDEILHDYDDSDDISVAMPLGLEYQFRSYDASVTYAIGRKAYLYCLQTGYYTGKKKYADEEVLIRAVHSGIQESAEGLRETIERRDVDYLITKNELQMDDYLAEAGCTAIGKTENYTIFSCKN